MASFSVSLKLKIVIIKVKPLEALTLPKKKFLDWSKLEADNKVDLTQKQKFF